MIQTDNGVASKGRNMGGRIRAESQVVRTPSPIYANELCIVSWSTSLERT